MLYFENNLHELVRQCHAIGRGPIKGKTFFPRIVSLRKLRCSPFDSKSVAVERTPYFDFFTGKRNKLTELIHIRFNENFSQKIARVGDIFGRADKYLGGDYISSPIVVDANLNIIDGVVRAARLLSLGATHVVVAEERIGEVNHSMINLLASSDEEVDSYLVNITKSFREWYSPFSLGPYSIPKRTYPDFMEQWTYDDSEGIANWRGAIQHVLPHIAKKNVLDIGCSIGLFSIEMARMGANVCGVDRGPTVFQPNNHMLGEQSVPNQAYAIRNVSEYFYKESIPNLAFAELDLMDFDFKHTHSDLFFSCRVLYHLGKDRMSEIIYDVSKNIPEIILQANEGHSGSLGKIAKMDFHKQILKKCGYVIKSEFAPTNSNHPIIYAVKN